MTWISKCGLIMVALSLALLADGPHGFMGALPMLGAWLIYDDFRLDHPKNA